MRSSTNWDAFSISRGCRQPTYKVTNCPDIDGGCPGIPEGDFGGAEDSWLIMTLSHGRVGGNGCLRIVSKSEQKDRRCLPSL